MVADAAGGAGPSHQIAPSPASQNPSTTAFRRLNDSISFDWRLSPYDVDQSLAHAAMLAAQGIITEAERDELHRGAGPGPPRARRRHLPVRRRRRGHPHGDRAAPDRDRRARRRQAAHRPLAQRPGRHRHGDVRARARRGGDRADRAAWRGTLVALAERHLDWPMPGYTHLQRAQPVYLSHHLLAYVWMLLRDRERFAPSRRHRAAAPRRRARWRASTSTPTAARWPPSLGSPAWPRTRSTPSPTGTSSSTTWPPRPPAPPICRAWAPRSCCGRPRSSASVRSLMPGPRARRSCRRRRTPMRPSCCEPRRPGWWPTWWRCTA